MLRCPAVSHTRIEHACAESHKYLAICLLAWRKLHSQVVSVANIWGGSLFADVKALQPPLIYVCLSNVAVIQARYQQELERQKRTKLVSTSSSSCQTHASTRTVATSALVSAEKVARGWAAKHRLYFAPMSRQENIWWRHFLSCIRLPRGGLSGEGSQQCLFEYSVPSEEVLAVIMKGTDHHPKQRWNGTCTPPGWEPSPSIDTYAALTQHDVDHYLQLHRRHVSAKKWLFRGSLLTKASKSHASCSIVITVLPPLLIEVCKRSFDRQEVVTTFNLSVLNDAWRLKMPPKFEYPLGFDLTVISRVMGHLDKFVMMGGPVSQAFRNRLEGFPVVLSASEEDTESSEAESLGWDLAAEVEAVSLGYSSSESSIAVSPQPLRAAGLPRTSRLTGEERVQAYTGADSESEAESHPH